MTQKSTVVIEDLDEVQNTRREILSWLEDKLEKAEEIRSLALGMGLTESESIRRSFKEPVFRTPPIIFLHP